MLIVDTLAHPVTTSEVLDVAFPEGRTSGTLDLSVHVIAQGAEPRWILLGDPRKALAVLRSWRPYNLASRARWSTILVATATGLLDRLPGIVSSCARIDFSYWQRISSSVDGRTAVIHIGNRSHTRKAIVFFPRQGGRVEALAKIPLVPAAADAILNESMILDRLQSLGHLPRILHRDFGRGIAVQTWLEGKQVSRSFTPAHLTLLSALANPGTVTRISNFRSQIADQLNSIDLPFDRLPLYRALDLLECDHPLPGFVEHRDFAPWNLKRLGNGELCLLDWEWSVLDGLPWQDISRYFYIQDALFNGPGEVYRKMCSSPLLKKYSAQFEIPFHILPALTMHYLLRVFFMDWQAGSLYLANYAYKQIKALLAEISERP